MKLADFVTEAQSRLDHIFRHYLIEQTHSAAKLQESMAYAVLNGGKRIRPLLVYLTGYALDAIWENMDPAASAVELIHVYSLIHDDLPAMDNSDLRRGKPTCHKIYGDAIAILAGDTLQSLAFEILATHSTTLNPKQRLNMIQKLSLASGIHGMAAGQALDLSGMTTLESLTQMYQLKTGALLTASVLLGAIAANNENPQLLTALETFAKNIGLAFQIQDDLLDIEGTVQLTGKPQGIDLVNEKITYPSLIGIDKSRQAIQTLFKEALGAIECLGPKGQLLHDFANYLLQRQK
jgi:farnesyl diphosphate synthase